MFRLLLIFFLSLALSPLYAQFHWEATAIKMDERFEHSIEISSITYLNGYFYLPSPRCDSVYIGRINANDSLEIDLVKPLGDCDFEGISYLGNFFYFSDDGRNSIYKYASSFESRPQELPIKLNGNDGVEGNDGFEGLAVVNDSTFYILLEKDRSKRFSVLYQGIFRNGEADITTRRLLALGNFSRYCDLFYESKSNTLFLLKTTRGRYLIDSLSPANIDTIDGENSSNLNPSTVVDFSSFVNAILESYNTNIEGIIKVGDDTFYVISDNCQQNDAENIDCTCGKIGERKKTLFMRLERHF